MATRDSSILRLVRESGVLMAMVFLFVCRVDLYSQEGPPSPVIGGGRLFLDVEGNAKFNPEASADDTPLYLPGDSLHSPPQKQIRQKKKTGKVVPQETTLIAVDPEGVTATFRIISTTNYRGFAMNVGSLTNDDFSFAPKNDNNHGPKVVNFKSDKTARIKLWCKDYGGKCRVQAVIVRTTGGPITIEKDIPLDLDTEPNEISDAWPYQAGDASDDLDDTPAGDGTPGDNLTLYEEYRGFVCQGIHVRTLPTEKDVFVRNKHDIGWGYLTTANLGAPVHYLYATELENYTTRLVNYNVAVAGAHFPQTAIVIENSAILSTRWGETSCIAAPYVPNNMGYCWVDVAKIEGFGAETTATIRRGDTTIPVVSSHYWRDSGKFRIGNEPFTYNGGPTGGFVTTFTGVIVARTHLAGSHVTNFVDSKDVVRWVFAHEGAHVMNLGYPHAPVGTHNIMAPHLDRGSFLNNGYWPVFVDGAYDALTGNFRVKP